MILFKAIRNTIDWQINFIRLEKYVFQGIENRSDFLGVEPVIVFSLDMNYKLFIIFVQTFCHSLDGGDCDSPLNLILLNVVQSLIC